MLSAVFSVSNTVIIYGVLLDSFKNFYIRPVTPDVANQQVINLSGQPLTIYRLDSLPDGCTQTTGYDVVTLGHIVTP